MSVSQHRHDDMQMTQNQKNQMSEDPGDGARRKDAKTKEGREPTNQIPEEQTQNQGTIEAFGQEGAGIAPKE
ncbi:MAG TPA: hypothetical protein VF693_02775 [Allosphingosinicella sp.]|jgi:hypothetical protein